VTLSGTRSGRDETFDYTDLGLRERGGEPFVARLWASRKIGVMMAEIRRHGPDPELVDAIVELSSASGSLDRGGGVMPSAPAAAADEYAEEEAARVAEMPASGAAAVAASEAQNAMQATTAVRDEERMRFAGGKTFVQQGTVLTADGVETPLWVDTAYRDQKPITWVLFGSGEYFDLAQDATTADWLSVGAEVVVVMPDNTVVRITTNQDVVERQRAAEAPVSPVATPEAESSESGAD
jgi:Ca-activated chloride channel family protein